MLKNNNKTINMSKKIITVNLLIYVFFVCFYSIEVSAQYSPAKHQAITDAVIPISKPGSYAVPGATYMLANNISSPMSAIFLGKDVTLDQNGYTITFADASYEHIPNLSFEDGLKSCDISKAPRLKILKDTFLLDTRFYAYQRMKKLCLKKFLIAPT